ncbi:glycosyltransferase [Heliobacterium gestii]|uniref:Glucosyl-3-phosphoglycerate synthase n=1 Tax=Heliomicrobium gestii TaxID=2699 RepID=A0A845LKQ2_HELGE|nr:glycosyltransferase involved in cell wall biosynthesis [Heliomicrobium gestii]MZP43436.1 glycosyltransferase [Heliomicrobium gestii]
MTLSVIIPAYNEESTVAPVVQAALASPYRDEVIVVSDGSEDQTAFRAQAAGAQVIELSENKGKGAAMLAGALAAHYPFLLFLDADLIGLRPEHLIRLAAPVIEGRADMTVGIFEHGRSSTDLAQLVAPYLSGQRAIKKEIFLDVNELEDSRYGVEIALTRHFRHRSHLRLLEVILPGLTHRMKEEKLGLIEGVKARIRMYREIGSVFLERDMRGERDDIH